MRPRISIDGSIAVVEYRHLALHYAGGIMEASLEGAIAAAPEGLQCRQIQHEELGSIVVGYNINPPIKLSMKRFPEGIGAVLTVGFNQTEGRRILHQLSRAAQLSTRISPTDTVNILVEEYADYLQQIYAETRAAAAYYRTDEECAFGMEAYQQFLERSTSLSEEEIAWRVLSAYIIPKAGVSPLLH